MARQPSISRKLTLMLWGASLVMFAGGGAAWVWHQQTAPRRLEAALEPYAQLLSISLPRVVGMRATNQVTEILVALRAAPAVMEAAVTDMQGRPLGVYRSRFEAPPRPVGFQPEGLYVTEGDVRLVRDIRVDGQAVGQLHLWSRVALLDSGAKNFSHVFVGMGGLLLVLTFWQTWRVRRAVIEPIAALTAKVDNIIEKTGLQPVEPVKMEDELERLDAHVEQMHQALAQRQKELQAANDFLKAVLDNAAPAIISVNLQGTITGFNPAAERLLGYKAEEVVNRRTPLLFHDSAEIKERAEELSRLMGQPVSEDMEVFFCLPRRGQTDAREWTYICRDGRRVTVWLALNPLVDAQGQLKGYVGIAEDLTERKQQEQELRRKNEEMERFIYTVSHDLKSPLVTIKGFVGELLHALEEKRYDQMAGDLKRVAAATDKMSELLNDLLELSRVGRVKYPATEVSLEHVAREALMALEGVVREGGVEVIIQPDLPKVFADRHRLFEVYLNLMENAVKFMGPQPSPRVIVGWESGKPEPVFFVQDNGIGVPPAYQETIFGLFNKLDNESPGTGLGLAIVRRIIEVHGGRIWVESEGRGCGSRFCFTLGGEVLMSLSKPASSTEMCDESASSPHPVGGG